MRHFKNRLIFLTLLVFWGAVSPVSATKLRIHIQNADPSENLKTKVIEVTEGWRVNKLDNKTNPPIIIEGSKKRGLFLDLSEKRAKGDLQQLEFVFPGPEKGQRESLLVMFSKEFLEMAGQPTITKVRVTKIKQRHDLIQEFSYMPTEDQACPAGSQPWETQHHLYLKILPKEKDVEITNSYEEKCE
ncbi:MAG: hypothetical protein ACRCTK_02960 [Alphaproteobacteria bacterium]